MSPYEPTVLAGRFVRLEPVRMDHLDDLWEAAQDPDVWTWMTVDQPKSKDEMATRVAEMVTLGETRSQAPFAVIHENRVVGTTRLFDWRPYDQWLEIGYTWYGPSARGTKVNPEAKLLLLEHCFERCDLVRVQLKTDALNARSRAAISKLGASYEGTLRSLQKRHDDRIRDTAMYSILREEWPWVKQSLTTRLQS